MMEMGTGMGTTISDVFPPSLEFLFFFEGLFLEHIYFVVLT